MSAIRTAVKHCRLLSIADTEAKQMAKRWLITCSCGWERECSSEWAARSVSKLHPQLAPMDVAHVTRVEGSDDGAGGQQLTAALARYTERTGGGRQHTQSSAIIEALGSQ